MFLEQGSKRSQNIGSNRSQFTYSCEFLNVRERQSLQDKADVFNMLRNCDNSVYDFMLGSDLDSANWEEDQNLTLRGDIEWRARNLGRHHTFWDLVRSDLPWQLTEGIRSDVDEPDMHHIPEFEKQMLSQHRVYSKVVVVRDSFQCFRRTDGMTPDSLANDCH